MTNTGIDRDHEWLEADGLGGWASGTTLCVNTRRYHGLLVSAVRPPADRHVLVNDAAVWLEIAGAVHTVSQHYYGPDFLSPSEAQVVGFEPEPWPRWTFAFDGTTFQRELITVHGLPLVLCRWRFGVERPGWKLCVRPLLSCRDFHSLHRENPGFDFSVKLDSALHVFQPYSGGPRVLSLAGAGFEHSPDWYRNFLYERERERGLDHTEDLASPGVLKFDLSEPDANWLIGLDTEKVRAFLRGKSAKEASEHVRSRESSRRAEFSSPLVRAADAYIVERGAGRTVIAGYPWFGDWGRDTFIALRGLCFARQRYREALEMLLAWSKVVSEGMLPNRFSDHADEQPEYNSVDAALWYVIAVGTLLDAATEIGDDERRELVGAVRQIVEYHLMGTRHGIRVDDDGLLAAGAPGVQLTWMDAKVGDWVVTPRVGKPVEVQALWLNALSVARRLTGSYGVVYDRGFASFQERFFNEATGCLYDVIDVGHVRGAVDGSLRPNQVLAVGGLPVTLLPRARCRAVLEVVERELWTPMGLRSLSPDHPDYKPRYEGGVLSRDSAYHQGAVWPWLAGPFVEAWVKARGSTPEARREARLRFFGPLKAHLKEAGVGHVSEIADGAPPHVPQGCPFQAWSVSELVRLEVDVLRDPALDAGRLGSEAVEAHRALESVGHVPA